MLSPLLHSLGADSVFDLCACLQYVRLCRQSGHNKFISVVVDLHAAAGDRTFIVYCNTHHLGSMKTTYLEP